MVNLQILGLEQFALSVHYILKNLKIKMYYAHVTASGPLGLGGEQVPAGTRLEAP